MLQEQMELTWRPVEATTLFPPNRQSVQTTPRSDQVNMRETFAQLSAHQVPVEPMGVLSPQVGPNPTQNQFVEREGMQQPQVQVSNYMNANQGAYKGMHQGVQQV